MVFAIAVGVLLGASGLQAPAAAGVLAACLIGKIVFDIKWDRVPLLGRRSPFVVYCHNLSVAGESTDQAHISYALQLIVFGLLSGSAAYAVVRYFV